MIGPRLTAALLLIMAAAPAMTARAQGPRDPAAVMATQREAMASLSFIDGIWRGQAWILLPSGEKQAITQTERVGSMLDGTVRVLEGRGYDADGKVAFRALGVISHDPADRVYRLHSYAQGRAGDFVLTPTADGFTWDIPAGPMKIRYTAVIRDGTWNEVGERILPGKEPARFFEMNLTRLGDSDWPEAGAVGPE
jgi:hypothetical protein